jgi:hypothetical protein
VLNSKPLRQLDFASLSEMCFWGAKILHFRSVELAQSQNVPLVLKQLGGAEHSTQVMREVMGMESGKVLAVNSMARIEHVEIDSANLNQGFEKFARHLKQKRPILATAPRLGFHRRKNSHYDDFRFGVARHFAAFAGEEQRLAPTA